MKICHCVDFTCLTENDGIVTETGIESRFFPISYLIIVFTLNFVVENAFLTYR